MRTVWEPAIQLVVCLFPRFFPLSRCYLNVVFRCTAKGEFLFLDCSLSLSLRDCAHFFDTTMMMMMMMMMMMILLFWKLFSFFSVGSESCSGNVLDVQKNELDFHDLTRARSLDRTTYDSIHGSPICWTFF